MIIVSVDEYRAGIKPRISRMKTVSILPNKKNNAPLGKEISPITFLFTKIIAIFAALF